MSKIKDEIESIKHWHIAGKTDKSVFRKTSVLEDLEYCAAHYPDKTAVIHKNRKISYSLLNARANQLARMLSAKNKSAQKIIGIIAERSINTIIGIYGILKAGAAYLPIDPEYPVERINYIINDSKTDCILVPHKVNSSIKFKGSLIKLNENGYSQLNKSNINIKIKPDTLAYIIYTSGSIGAPKGVMIEHRSLLNLAHWHISQYGISESDNCAEYASFSFDSSISQIFSPLSAGATLHILDNGERYSPVKLNRYLEKNNISYIDLPTKFCEKFLELTDNRSLRVMTTGGEKLKKYYPSRFELYDEYGPTECTVITTNFKVDRQYENIPIGAPITNCGIYILDENLKPVNRGESGEIYVYGSGIARGYLNKPDLTAQKFIKNPFDSKTRIYRTGDIGRINENGVIEVSGRIDNQIKIRGYRIEPEEIEQKLISFLKIKNAVVIPSVSQDKNYLIACYEAGQSIDHKSVKAKLAKHLPDYMIPEKFVRVDELPVSATGKTDRKKTAEIFKNDHSIKYLVQRPTNKKESAILQIFRKITGNLSIGIKDNYFEGGLDSLAAITFAVELQRIFKCGTNDIFRCSTISELAGQIEFKKSYSRKIFASLKKLLKKHLINSRAAFRELKPEIETYKTETANIKIEKHSAKYKNIMLTGATGYLGIHILKTLISENFENIYLLARDQPGKKSGQRITDLYKYYFNDRELKAYKDRIHFLSGDIRSEYLFSDKSLFDKIAAETDCVIHCAADVNHYGYYENFYNTNVTGVKNIIEFCRTSSIKDLHHISTIDVAAGTIKNKRALFFNEKHCDAGQQPDTYYAETKLAAEKLVIDARAKGLNSNIYRIGNITFNSQTGKLQANIEKNAFFMLAEAYYHIGALPAGIDEFDFSFVDNVSAAVILLMKNKKLLNSNFHIINPHKVSLTQLFNAADLPKKIKTIAVGEFIDYIEKKSSLKKNRHYIDTLIVMNEWADLNNESTKFITAADMTNSILEKLGFNWQKINSRITGDFINRLTQIKN